MSLSRAQNIFMPANINSIVIFFDRYVVGPVPELPETPTHLSLLSDSVMRTPALNELSDEEKAGVCVSLCVQAPFYSCSTNRGSEVSFGTLAGRNATNIIYTTKENRFTVTLSKIV